MKCLSIGNAEYSVTLFDEYKCFCTVRFMKAKSKTSRALEGKIPQQENIFNKRVESISCVDRKWVKSTRSDGGVNILDMNSANGKRGKKLFM